MRLRHPRLTRAALPVLLLWSIAVLLVLHGEVARAGSSNDPTIAAAGQPGTTASDAAQRTGTVVKTPGGVGTEPVPAGFPTAATTGVPVGTVLQPYRGPGTITKAGTVVSDVLITGCLRIRGNRITVRDSKIVCGQRQAALYVDSSSSGVVISHVEVDGTNHATVGIQIKNAVVQNANVHGSGDGVHLGQNATFEDSYVHDLGTLAGIHHDDMQTLAGSTASNIRIFHNTLQAYTAKVADNSVYHMGSGAISNIVIQDNFIDGGHYSIEVANVKRQHDITIIGNHFGRHFHFGILTATGPASPVTMIHNIWQQTGKPATAANSKGYGLG